MKRAQTGLEYLILIGGVLLVALVVGSFLTTAASNIYNKVTGTSGATLNVQPKTGALAYWSGTDALSYVPGSMVSGAGVVFGGPVTAPQFCLKGTCITSWPSGGASKSIWKQNGSDIYYTDGKVGIGTNSPTYDLDVNGSINAKEICIGGDCRTNWPSGGPTSTITGVSITDIRNSFVNNTETLPIYPHAYVEYFTDNTVNGATINEITTKDDKLVPGPPKHVQVIGDFESGWEGWTAKKIEGFDGELSVSAETIGKLPYSGKKSVISKKYYYKGGFELTKNSIPVSLSGQKYIAFFYGLYSDGGELDCMPPSNVDHSWCDIKIDVDTYVNGKEIIHYTKEEPFSIKSLEKVFWAALPNTSRIDVKIRTNICANGYIEYNNGTYKVFPCSGIGGGKIYQGIDYVHIYTANRLVVPLTDSKVTQVHVIAYGAKGLGNTLRIFLKDKNGKSIEITSSNNDKDIKTNLDGMTLEIWAVPYSGATLDDIAVFWK